MSIVKNKMLRYFLLILGGISLILGIIGAFLPLLPTTPFILLSTWLFLKSSPQAHSWILRQPLLGPSVKNWEERRAISRSAKILSLSMMFFSLLLMWWRVKYLPLKIGVSILLFSVGTFIITRPEN